MQKLLFEVNRDVFGGGFSRREYMDLEQNMYSLRDRTLDAETKCFQAHGPFPRSFRGVLPALLVDGQQDFADGKDWETAEREMCKAIGFDGVHGKRYPSIFDFIQDHINIRAWVTMDGDRKAVNFNAHPYFEQASDDELRGLLDCDFRGDYPADRVAEFMAFLDPDVARFFQVHKSFNNNLTPGEDAIGFEVVVNAHDALRFIRENRPQVEGMVAASPDASEGNGPR